MIRNTESLSMIEAMEYMKKEDTQAELVGFIKKFNKLSVKEAKEIRDKINGLGLMKVRAEHISKIIDVMPENIQDLNKIFVDMSLEEDEAKKILDTIKEFI